MKINLILALAAFILGISALFTDYSDKNEFYPAGKFNRERIGAHKVDLVTPHHLADLIYRKEKGLVIVDVRTRGQFEKYHIPGSLHAGETIREERLQQAGMIVLVGRGDMLAAAEAAQTMSGEVFLLEGGMPSWYSIVLFPDFDRFRIRNSQMLNHIVNRSRYFGGAPQNTGSLNLNLRAERYREGC